MIMKDRDAEQRSGEGNTVSVINMGVLEPGIFQINTQTLDMFD